MTTATARPTSSRPTPPRSVGVPSGGLEWTVGTVAFLAEIALVVVAGRAAFHVTGGGAVGGLATLAAVILTVGIWARWMSPRAGRRLRLQGRLLLGSTLMTGVGTAAILTGSSAAGWALGIGGALATLIGQPMLFGTDSA